MLGRPLDATVPVFSPGLAGIASQSVPACVLTVSERPRQAVRRRPIATRSSHLAARARGWRPFAPIGGNKRASS